MQLWKALEKVSGAFNLAPYLFRHTNTDRTFVSKFVRSLRRNRFRKGGTTSIWSLSQLWRIKHCTEHAPVDIPSVTDMTALMECFVLERCNCCSMEPCLRNDTLPAAFSTRLPPPQKFPRSSSKSKNKAEQNDTEKCRQYYKRMSRQAMGQIICKEESGDWSRNTRNMKCKMDNIWKSAKLDSEDLNCALCT